MKDILILGAGVTGLSMGQLLNGKSNVTILERRVKLEELQKQGRSMESPIIL